MKPVQIYMKPTCPYSRRAMALLQGKEVPFDAIDVSADPQREAEMEQRTGRHTVPQIFIGARHVGGSDDLLALNAQGKLDALLQ